MKNFNGLKVSSSEWQAGRIPEEDKLKADVTILEDENNNNKNWIIKNKYGARNTIALQNGIWREIP